MKTVLDVAVALYGVFIGAMSAWILVNPESWAAAATAYCKKWYLHPVEIAIALTSGVVFVAYAPQSLLPGAFRAFGYFLCVLATVLVFVPPSLHRRYGVWSVAKVRPFLRPLAIPCLILGVLLIWLGFSGQ